MSSPANDSRETAATKRCHERFRSSHFSIFTKAHLIPLNPGLEANNQKILIFFVASPSRRCQTAAVNSRLFACLRGIFSLLFHSIFFARFKFIVDSVALVREAFHSRMNLCTCRASQNLRRGEAVRLAKMFFRFDQSRMSRRVSLVPIAEIQL